MKSTSFTDHLGLSGHLTIFKGYSNGTREEIFSEDNLITLAAKQYVLLGFYSPGIPSDPINSLHVGTGGTVDPQGLYPRPEDPASTNLRIPLLSVVATFTTDLTIPSVTFLADLDQGTGNSNLITEAGLFKAGGAIFNIKNFPGIPKTSEFSLHFSWTIKLA